MRLDRLSHVVRYTRGTHHGPKGNRMILITVKIEKPDDTNFVLGQRGWVMVAAEGVADAEAVKGWARRAMKFVGKLPAK